MKQDLFTYLPSEIFIDILLRLSLQTVAICKSVCKEWLSEIESNAFLESHLSKSAPALVVSMPATYSNWFNIFKFEDSHRKKHDIITKFDFPQVTTIQGSAHGLLLLKNPFIDHLYVCNPITREFVELHGRLTRPWRDITLFGAGMDCYGIGVSKISGQHKVVYYNLNHGCHVFTLETGSSWRSVETPSLSFARCFGSNGAFVNGNLHWLVSDWNRNPYICCFDLETECLSTFSTPSPSFKGKLYTLGDCLCFCDDETYPYYFDDENVVYLLKKYEQVEKYWCKVYVIDKYNQYYSSAFITEPSGRRDYFKRLQPIKVYRNGNMLMLWNEKLFLYHSNKKQKLIKIGLFGKMDDDCYYINSILLTPSFLSLKRNLGMLNVMSF